jgi:hypothetical protein
LVVIIKEYSVSTINVVILGYADLLKK